MINGIGRSGLSPLGVGSAATSAPARAPGAPGAPGVAAEDKAAVSTSMGQIAGQGAPVDTDRVAALKAAIAAGAYRADPRAIAAGMIASDLGNVQ
jgi:negative regulator of flagellin synthesis FlgM